MKPTYFQILKDIIKIPSPSGSEQKLARYIVANYCQNGWTGEMDEVSNILLCPEGDKKDKNLPLLYAHLDTYPNGQSNDHLLCEEDIIILDDDGQVQKKYEIQMGFDDKAGVAAILYLMNHTKLRFRALLVAQEEVSDLPRRFGRNGGGGIDFAIKSFGWVFGKSTCVLSLDRKNGNEIIDEYGSEINPDRPRINLCSKAYREGLLLCSEQAGYPMQIGTGRIADVYNIRFSYPDLNCVNLSVGYYNEHRDNEFFKIDEVLGIIKVMIEFLSQE